MNDRAVNADQPIGILDETAGKTTVEPRAKYATLDTINEYCLREICQYLCVIDIAKVAATCKRLREFGENEINMKVKKVEIVLYVVDLALRIGGTYHEMTQKGLVAHFGRFGSFVENIILFGCDSKGECPKYIHEFEKVLRKCTNLKKLKIFNVFFTRKNAFNLQHASSTLNEFEMWECWGIDHNFVALDGSNLEKLSLLYMNVNFIRSNFFQQCTNLLSLNISLHHESDLNEILDITGHRLEYLSLEIWNEIIDYQSIGLLIANKLPKLKYLAIQDHRENNVRTNNYMNEISDLAHLKRLVLECSEFSVNSLLRKLSNNNIIEDLTIKSGIFCHEGIFAAPLLFRQLRKLEFSDTKNINYILKTLTEASMPEIVNFQCNFLIENDVNDLLALISSKRTLKSVRVYGSRFDKTFAVVKRIIEVLRTATRKRPCLELDFGYFSIGLEEVGENSFYNCKL